MQQQHSTKLCKNDRSILQNADLQVKFWEHSVYFFIFIKVIQQNDQFWKLFYFEKFQCASYQLPPVKQDVHIHFF